MMSDQEEYKDLYETAPVGLWRTHIDNGHFIHANEAAINILGFSDFDDLSTHSATDLYDAKEREELIQELRRHGEVSDFQVAMKRKDGKEIFVNLSAKLNEEKGYIEGTIRDMTGIISIKASAIIPHLEKMSELKKHILEKINGDCSDSDSLNHRISKTA